MAMPECLTPEALERYRRSAAGSPGEVLTVEEHLAGCPACRSALQTAVRGAASAAAQRLAPPVEERTCLEEEALARCAAGESDATERDLVEEHAARCARC